MEGNGTIRVCVGNYGYYAEGDPRHAWVELPKSDEELRRFLRDNGLQDPAHEEVYISEFDGYPLGIRDGELFGEATSLEALNLLAKQMETADPEALERVSRIVGCGFDAPSSITGLMNWIEQADDLPPFNEWPDDFEYRSADERLGYAIVDVLGGADALDQETLERNFDYASYGAELAIEFPAVGETAYIDDGTAIDERWYSEPEIVAEAGLDPERSLAEQGVKDPAAAVEDARYRLAVDWGVDPLAVDAPDAVVLAADEIARGLPEQEANAVRMYWRYVSSSTDVRSFANVALQADDIGYGEINRSDILGPDGSLGASVVERLGGIEALSREELGRHFDYKAFGEEVGQEYLTSEEGYMLATSRMPSETAYSRSELEGLVEARWEASRDEPGSRLLRFTGGSRAAETGALSPDFYSFPDPSMPDPKAGTFAFRTEEESMAAMRADFDALAAQMDAFAADPASPLAFGSPEKQLDSMRVIAAWHGGGRKSPEMEERVFECECAVRSAQPSRGAAVAEKTPDNALGAASRLSAARAASPGRSLKASKAAPK